MLAIYHWEPNANSGKPILAALEKGVEFDSHYIDMLAFQQHSPEYLKVNPNGTIPAMIHEGNLVPESTVMMEYIDATFRGPPLRPTDAFERWRMRLERIRARPAVRAALSMSRTGRPERAFAPGPEHSRWG